MPKRQIFDYTLNGKQDELKSQLDDLKAQVAAQRKRACDESIRALVFMAEAHLLEKKERNRCRKPTPENAARDEALRKEKTTKTWKQLFMDHPEEEPARLRSAVRRAKKRLY